MDKESQSKEKEIMYEDLAKPAMRFALGFAEGWSTEDFIDELYGLGYRKVVWHKVAERDWPKEFHEVRFVDNTGCHHNGYFVEAHSAFYKNGDIKYDIDEIVAWTELPTYKE